MTMTILLLHVINLLFVPLLLVGVICKIKAFMQCRVGAPVLQPFFDVLKLFGKCETISVTASWLFRQAPCIGLAVALLAAVLIPWSGPLLPVQLAPATNFLLVLYLLSLGKFIAMLAAMDTGSAFGGLGASREATISMLVEPALVMGLAAMGLYAHSTDLLTILNLPGNPVIAGLVGMALVLVALAELSRMPVDDPTTHLELTMVHEAMILENSGRNLALVELAMALRTCIFLGLAAQTLLHTWQGFTDLPFITKYILSLSGLFLLGIAVAVMEGVVVKLRWRKVSNFLAFATVLSILAALLAAVQV